MHEPTEGQDRNTFYGLLHIDVILTQVHKICD
jgi:hypothetical protein